MCHFSKQIMLNLCLFLFDQLCPGCKKYILFLHKNMYFNVICKLIFSKILTPKIRLIHKNNLISTKHTLRNTRIFLVTLPRLPPPSLSSSPPPPLPNFPPCPPPPPPPIFPPPSPRFPPPSPRLPPAFPPLSPRLPPALLVENSTSKFRKIT